MIKCCCKSLLTKSHRISLAQKGCFLHKNPDYFEFHKKRLIFSKYDNRSDQVSYVIEPIPGAGIDNLIEDLMEAGAQAVIVNPSREGERDEEKIYGSDRTKKMWNWCRINANFPIKEDSGVILMMKQKYPDVNINTSISNVNDIDWMQLVKDSYRPIDLGIGWWAIPTWSQNDYEEKKCIILEPGIAFGIGDHSTTRLCLKELSKTVMNDKRVMDYGTGSGILAIFSLLNHAQLSVATDIDKVAIEATKINAKLNNVEDRLNVFEIAEEGRDIEKILNKYGNFDICVTNLVQTPLLNLKQIFSKLLKKNGKLIMSGILKEQVLKVKDAYQENFKDMSVETFEDWAMIRAYKK